jgi:hypothetical protein
VFGAYVARDLSSKFFLHNELTHSVVFSPPVLPFWPDIMALLTSLWLHVNSDVNTLLKNVHTRSLIFYVLLSLHVKMLVSCITGRHSLALFSSTQSSSVQFFIYLHSKLKSQGLIKETMQKTIKTEGRNRQTRKELNKFKLFKFKLKKVKLSL